MRLFTHARFESLPQVFLMHLQGLYDAERRIVEALGDLIATSANPLLRGALAEHLGDSQGQLARLGRVFDRLGATPMRRNSPAVTGLLNEVRLVRRATGDEDVKDAVLIGIVQEIEHYLIANYGTARAWAARLGHGEIAELLQGCLDEERRCDRRLTAIAEHAVNISAGFGGAAAGRPPK